ncbi:MAG TPA: glutamate--tRNA ligase [Candidatus Paceibacterota bacterium]
MVKIITRFAPSPTGFMHVGSVRTALYAWLWARKHNGTFILRIEDTDKEREVAGSTEHIMESLKWLGLFYDEGPDKCEEGKCYTQSERLETYKKYAQILIDKGFAYPDPYSKEEMENFRKQAEEEKRPFLYRDHRPEKFGTWDGRQALRFKTPEIKSYKWHDLVYGDLSAGVEALDDFILIKSDGYPTYNFAHIVDDIEMGITHVMRGEEFISSTPKYLSVYDAFAKEPPLYATLPVILGPEGKKKLSKRDGAKDLLEYREEGYLPDAFINFLALLGWNPGTDQEIFTRDELIRAFDIERVQKSGAQMSQEKLDWINKEHIKKLPKEEIEKNILERLPEKYQDLKIVPIILERISKWGDVKNMVDSGELDFFFTPPEIEKDKLPFRNISAKRTSTNLKLAVGALTNIEGADFTAENVKNALMLVAGHLPSRGELLHPVRFALSGKDKSPDPFTIAYILGKNETISRLQKAI